MDSLSLPGSNNMSKPTSTTQIYQHKLTTWFMSAWWIIYPWLEIQSKCQTRWVPCGKSIAPFWTLYIQGIGLRSTSWLKFYFRNDAHKYTLPGQKNPRNRKLYYLIQLPCPNAIWLIEIMRRDNHQSTNKHIQRLCSMFRQELCKVYWLEAGIMGRW